MAGRRKPRHFYRLTWLLISPPPGPENALDGILDNYGGQGGFEHFRVPGSLTVELPQAATVARAQVLLWADFLKDLALRDDDLPHEQNNQSSARAEKGVFID